MAPVPGVAGCRFDRFCLNHPLPCKAISAKNAAGASVRDRSGHDKALAVVVAYLRVSAVQALTSVYSGTHRSSTQSDEKK